MTEQEVQRVLEKGEGITVEYKRAEGGLPKNIFETVCAFLNRNGGTILLGVEDDGTVKGIDSGVAETICKQFADLSNNATKLDPVFLLHPTVIDFQGKKLIHVFVPASSQVHQTDRKVFDRSSDGDFVVKADAQVSDMYFRKRLFFSEGLIYPYLTESHFVDGIVEKAKTIIRSNRPNHPWLILPNKEFFQAAGLYRTDIKTGEEGFTLAALVLFGREEIIQSALPHYKIDALVRKTDLYRYDDRENIRCNLISAYEILMNFVAKHLPDKFYLEDDRRVSLREKIFREIIANFLIHREYANAHPATLIIFGDRVETRNANKPHLIGKLEPGKFEPFPKNPNIAKFFVQMARAEDLGTGIGNVFRYLKPYSGKLPTFREEDLFITEVPLPTDAIDNITDVTDNVTDNVTDVTDDVTDNVTDSVTDNVTDVTDNVTDTRLDKILEAVQKNNRISALQLAKRLKVTKRTVLRDIEELKKRKLLERIGTEKAGHWKLLKR